MKQGISALFFVLLAITVILPGCGSVSSQNDQHNYNIDISNMLAAKWQNYISDKPGFGGGLAIYVLSPKGENYASNITGADKDTHFRCASVTKTFTAASIMLLSQQGKLDINDLITANIPGSSEPYVPNTDEYNIPYKNQITIKMLLRHRAGVWDVDNTIIPTAEPVPYAGQNYIEYTMSASAEHTFTFDELVSVDATCGLSDFAPDTAYQYSDTGYSMLGKIIERVSGKSYGDFVSDNFLVPNSMNRSSLPYLGSDTAIPAPYETGYSYTSGTSTDRTIINVSPNVAEGNVITAPSELTVWIGRLIKGQAGLSISTVNLMTAEASGGAYGLGLFAMSGLGYGHTGAMHGYVTLAFCDPKQDVSIVVSASVINLDDLSGEVNMMGDVALSAKNILGYSTAETY